MVDSSSPSVTMSRLDSAGCSVSWAFMGCGGGTALASLAKHIIMLISHNVKAN